jgi:MerR family transcriptional regulator, thiopeptide resistance regulator
MASDERTGRSRKQAVTFKVGDLARRAGVSVRTLHHYEDIGLLVPSERTDAGHRLYGRADLERLARIMGLTRLGLSLDETRQCLNDARWSPLRLVERHLERARAVLDEQRELCDRLTQLRESLLAQGEDDAESFIETVEVMNMIESYYTKEQLEQLAQRRESMGEEGMRKAQQDWTDLFADARAEMERGTPPDAPAVQALARRWQALVAAFTAGDPGIQQSLNRMYSEQPLQKIHPSFDPKLFEYMHRAITAGKAP